MPFFWVGGFGSGIFGAAGRGHPGDRGTPATQTTLRLLERERVTLFRGWPDQAEALARHPDRPAPTSPRCARAAWKPCCPWSSEPRKARAQHCSG